MFDKKNVEDIRILNNAQNSILIAGLKEQKIDAYIHHLCFDISGELDIDLMKKAYAHLLAKYSVLRSVILYKNLQKPVQVIMKTREDGLACIKITDEELEQETDKVIRKEKERLGKIEGTYMYHMFLLQRDQFHGRLILSFHHIILDGWSLGLVVVEFFQMYHRLKEGIKISEKEEFVLKDYLQWKKKNQMEEITPVLRDMMNLPVKPTGIEPQWTREDGFEEKACTHLLNKEFYSEIEIFCRKNNITSNAFFLGIWSILLANYNQTDEVSFGTVLSGRNVKVPSIEEAVGLFIQTVPIILKIDRKAYPLELMKIINEISLLYMKDPNSVDYCQEKGMQSYNHIVAFENYPIADLLVSKNDTFGVEISNIQYYGYTSFDFGFSLTPIHDETVEISIKYNAYCYTEAFMEQIIAGYNRLIEQALQVNVQIEDISLVDKETEKAVYLGNLDWNNKGTILERFEKILSENKNHMALVDSNKTITYEELDRQSNIVANKLCRLSAVEGTIVAVYAKRSAEMIIGMLAVLKTGAAYLPVNFDFAKGRMYQYLEEAEVKIILVQDAECEESIREDFFTVNIEESLSEKDADTCKPIVKVEEDMPAYVIYTSGSTGKPKGIGISHKNVINLINGLTEEIYDKYPKKLQVGVITSFMFDASVKQIYGALLNGNTLCIASEEDRSSGMQLLDFYKRTGIDISDGTPTHLRLLLNEMKQDETLGVKEFLIGGEQLTKEVAGAILKHSRKGENIVISNVYGPTECCVDTTIFRFDNINCINGLVVPIGKALKNYQTIIADRKENVVPKGVVGELLIGGPSVSKGYIRNPEETNKHFIENPYVPGKYLYKTGDLVKELPDGNIRFIGRADNQVKLNGYRMELDEIEQCILASGKVENAAVLVRTNTEQSQILCAFLETGEACDEKELRAYLKENLADYMVPSHFITLAKLPVNTNGKIDRKVLSIMDLNIQTDRQEYQAAENIVQEKLCSIFEKTLQVQKAGISNDFYELGGTSLNAINLISEIYKSFNVYLSPKIVFQYPVIKELAEQILLVRDKEQFTLAERKNAFYGKASREQQRIYALTYESEGESYHIQQGYLFEQPIDTAQLKACLTVLVNRYESLRTCFKVENGEVMQQVLPDAVLNCRVVEGEAFNSDIAREEYAKLRSAYSLETGYLYRFLIYQTKENTVLLFDAHHIILDGESVSILFGDMFKLLQRKTLSDINYHMLDYATWQESFCKSQEYKKKEEFFKSYLAGSCECQIPPDKKAKKDEVGTGCITLGTPLGIVNDLITLANDNRVTLNMLLSSAFSILLAKYTNAGDIMFGIVSANRKNLNFNQSVGMFVNTLVMRACPVKSKSFLTFLGEVKTLMINLVENEEYQYDDLQHLKEVPTNPIHVLFVMEKDNSGEITVPPYRVKTIRSEYSDAKFDVAFYCSVNENGLNLRVEYNTKLYYQKSVQNLANAYIALLSNILKKPGDTIGSLDITDEEQKKQILQKFNYTKRKYEKDSTINRLFKQEADKHPELAALVYQGIEISYRELDERTDRLAARLTDMGVKEGEVVALYLEGKAEQITAILAVLKAGGIYMPIDTAYPEKRIEYMLRDSQAHFVITEQEHKRKKQLEGYCCVVEAEDFNYPIGNITRGNGESPAYLMYTSGTTGNPKGVIVKHKNVIRLVNHTEFMEFKPEGRFLQTSSVVFDASTLEIWGSLLNGMTLYLTQKEELLDAGRVSEYIRQDKIDALWLSAPLFNQLSRGHEEMFRGVTWLLVGGDVLPAEQINKVREKNPGIHIINGYGPTENTTFSATFDIDGEYESIPIGYPITNSTLYILDEGHNLLPVGAVGEICVGGEGVAEGYLNDIELTEKKFIKNPYEEGERLYCTGDLGRWTEKGYVEFLGRKDEQVKIRGFRVETKEIENIVNRHKKIQESFIDVREKEGIKYLVLFYVGEINRKELKEYLKAELPEYMRPGYVVELNKMPLNANGKIDHGKMKEIEAKESLETEYVPPENSIEKELCQVWEEVLGLERVSITDNYYELGGDSIKAINISGKLYQRGIDINASDILRMKTIKHLSVLAEKTIEDEKTVIQYGKYELSPIQNWFYAHVEQEQNHFNQAVILRLKQKITMKELEKAWLVLKEHHELLNAHFEKTDGKRYMVIDKETITARIAEAAIRDENIAEQIENIAGEEERKLDIEHGPLCNIIKIKSSSQEYLLMIMHHLIIDNVSWRILIRSLAKVLECRDNKETISWKKTAAYMDWIKDVERYVTNVMSKEEQKKFRNPARLMGNSVMSCLAKDMEHRLCYLDEVHTGMLLGDIHKKYGTKVQDILVTALVTALKQECKEEFITLQMEGYGRENDYSKLNVSETIGWFTAIYPVEIALKQGGYEEQIIEVKDKINQVPNHGIGYNAYHYNEKTETEKKEYSYISINYLGSFEDDLTNEFVEASTYSVGEELTGKYRRPSIDLNMEIKQGKLVLQLDYGKNLYQEEDMNRLSRLFMQEIANIIDFCAEAGETITTLSDMNAEGLDDSMLDDIFKNLTNL